MHRAFSFPVTVERSRTKERLEASLAGLCELELRKQRQECLVLGALALGDPLPQDTSRGELSCFSSWGQENLTLRRQLVRSLCWVNFTACLDSSSSTLLAHTVLPHPALNPTLPLHVPYSFEYLTAQTADPHCNPLDRWMDSRFGLRLLCRGDLSLQKKLLNLINSVSLWKDVMLLCAFGWDLCLWVTKSGGGAPAVCGTDRLFNGPLFPHHGLL